MLAKNMAKKGVFKAVTISIGIIVLLIAAIILFFWGSIKFNSVRLKASSPMTHYLTNQDTNLSADITHFFEVSAPKEEVLAILSAQEYKPTDKPFARFGYELGPNKYAFQRNQISHGVRYINTFTYIQFDENDRLVSAVGHNGGSYW